MKSHNEKTYESNNIISKQKITRHTSDKFSWKRQLPLKETKTKTKYEFQNKKIKEIG